MKRWIKLAAVIVLVACQGNADARSPERRDELGRTPLMLAARAGDAAEVSRLVKAGAAVDARSKGRWTPLMYAVENGHADVVELLLAQGADPRVRGLDGTSAMASAFGQRRILEALLRAGAPVDDPREDLLMNAARLGLLDMAQTLLAYGADVNGRRFHRPLEAAIQARSGYADPDLPLMVALLLKAGARPTTDDLNR